MFQLVTSQHANAFYFRNGSLRVFFLRAGDVRVKFEFVSTGDRVVIGGRLPAPRCSPLPFNKQLSLMHKIRGSLPLPIYPSLLPPGSQHEPPVRPPLRPPLPPHCPLLGWSARCPRSASAGSPEAVDSNRPLAARQNLRFCYRRRRNRWACARIALVRGLEPHCARGGGGRFWRRR